MNNKIRCPKCHGLAVTLGWSGRPQITKIGSGEILASPYIDRLLNDDFYPQDKTPNENLDAWPRCPTCLEKLPVDEKDAEPEELFSLPSVDLWVPAIFLGLVFLAFLLALLFF